MKKHFYLVCDSYDNAFEKVRTAFKEKLLSAGGFVSMKEGDGTFSLYPAAAAVCREDYEGREFMRLSSPLWHDTEAFRENGVRLIEEAEYYPFALLAYIGGFELLIPQFRSALSDIISSELPTFAILLSESETENLRRILGIGDKLTAYSERFRAAVGADEDSFCVNTCDAACDELIRAWVTEYAV